MIIRRSIAVFLMVVLLLSVTATVYGAESGVDVSRLEDLLEISENLRESDYTAESWLDMRKAAYAASAAMDGTQADVDNAVKELATALTRLVVMDYSAMEDAVDQAEEFLLSGGQQWQQLQDALDEAETVYGCGDQAAVDRVAEKIIQGIALLRESAAPEEPVEEEKAPPVVWIVLFFVSLLGNAALIGWVVWKKKDARKQQIDDVPLVDYDIDDDVI